VITIQFTADKVKSKIFGYSSREPMSSLENQSESMKLFVTVMHHHPALRVPEPERTKKAEEVSVEPDKTNNE